MEHGRKFSLCTVLLASAVVAAGTAAAQMPATSPVEHLSFDRPESWALKYFVAATTFTPLAPPETRAAGTLDVGLELIWVPRLSDSERRVGFDGTTLEDLNKTQVGARPRLLVGLPAGFSAEVGWVPPIERHGGKANLLDMALERPFFEKNGFAVGLRAYGQIGHAKGDITCNEGVAAAPPLSPDNPLGCTEPSKDTATLNHWGAALTSGAKLPGGSVHLAAGATYNDVQFQVGAEELGVHDSTLEITHGWTGWIAGGGALSLGSSASFAIEAFYSPLLVRRPGQTDTRNDALFNARAMLRFRVR